MDERFVLIFFILFLLLAFLIFWPFKFTLYFGQNFTSLYGNFHVEFFKVDIKKSRYQLQATGINFIKKGNRQKFVDYRSLSQGSEFFERFGYQVSRLIDYKQVYYHYNLNADDLFVQCMTRGSFDAFSGALKGIVWNKLRCRSFAKMTVRTGEDNFLRARCIIRLSIADIMIAFLKTILGGKHGKRKPD